MPQSISFMRMYMKKVRIWIALLVSAVMICGAAAGTYRRRMTLQVVAVNEDSDIYSLQDLKGKVIAVQSTTKPEEILFLFFSEKVMWMPWQPMIH